MPDTIKVKKLSLKELRRTSTGWFVVVLVMLLQLVGCTQEPSKPIPAKESIQNNKVDTSSKLKFTSGISAILEDRKGNYWLGSHREGVCLFDGQQFTYFTTNDGLSDPQVRSIQEDHNGTIWFRTAKGISSYQSGQIKSYPLEPEKMLENKWHKAKNDLWFHAGNKEGVFRYDGQQFSYLAFPSPKIINPNNVYVVTSFAKGKNNMLWIGTYAGIFGFNGQQFTVINDETLGLHPATGELHIRSVFEDSKGRLWIGNNGIGVLLKEGDTTINFSEKNNLIYPGSSRRGDQSPAGTLEHVFAIEEDREGNIWFGDRDTGAWKYDGSTLKNYTRQAGLSHDFVQFIYKDRQDELWFGLADGQVFKFNGQSFIPQF